MLSSGLSSLHPLTRNPWHVAMNPGGSSAGAAAAAAAGYGPLHLGTDIGGSIRLPAAWCGVVGFKPSGGRVPIVPPYTGRVAGPLARSVADCALAMATLSRPDWRDATSLPAQAIDWGAIEPDGSRPLRGLKIGLMLDAGWGLPVGDETRGAVLDAARRLADAGAHVEPMPGCTTREMADGIDRFWRMRSWMDLSRLPAQRYERVLPFIRDWVAPAASYGAAQVFHDHSQMAALRDAAVAASQPFDFLLSPVAPVVSYDATWASPTNDPARAMEHIGFTLPWNMSEQPAISLPCAFTAGGLPIGIQLVGRRHDDLGLLRLARVWETLRAPLPAWPVPAA
jgi:Asp-tRNA(Asn)/Glu-tRNA(Gln) amidotransferase A subunit family amidase